MLLLLVLLLLLRWCHFNLNGWWWCCWLLGLRLNYHHLEKYAVYVSCFGQ